MTYRISKRGPGFVVELLSVERGFIQYWTHRGWQSPTGRRVRFVYFGSRAFAQAFIDARCPI